MSGSPVEQPRNSNDESMHVDDVEPVCPTTPKSTGQQSRKVKFDEDAVTATPENRQYKEKVRIWL